MADKCKHTVVPCTTRVQGKYFNIISKKVKEKICSILDTRYSMLDARYDFFATEITEIQ